MNLATRRGAPRGRPPIRSCGPAPLGLRILWKPGPRDLAACPSSAPWLSPRITQKPNLSGCALRPLRPSPTHPPTPFQGIRDLFYLQSLKKPVAKVTGVGTAGSLPWGRGFAPKQLSVGAVPAGTRAVACSGEQAAPRSTHSSPLSPHRPLHRKSPPVTFPGGNQPAGSKKAPITNKKTCRSAPPPPTHAHTRCSLSSFTRVGWAGGQKLPPPGELRRPGQVLLQVAPPPPVRSGGLFQSF